MSTSITQFNHLRIPLDEIQKATNNFSNILGKGDFGTFYKGQLLHSGELINISARRLAHTQGQEDKEFWTEISVLSCLKHPNIVSLIGFCDEKGEKIIIHRFEAKGSLSKYLSDPALTWIQRLKICHGVAKAISYIHYEKGRNYSIIHQNINSATILLDDNFEAKLSGFESSIKDSVDRTERYISSLVIRHPGYTDPETLKPGVDVTQKSDIYSFGVVLAEIMCGKTISTLKNAFPHLESDKLPAPYPIIVFHLELDMLHSILIPDMLNQMEPDSCRLFVESTLGCLHPDPVQRISMNDLLTLLNPLFEDQLRKLTPILHLRIPLYLIVTATSNFAAKNLIKEDSLGKDYKGQILQSGRSTNIVARRLDCIYGQEIFFGAISIHSSLKHKNIISFIGFCNENGEKILIYEHAVHWSLDQHLTDATLTWFQRLQICIGVARALSHVHYDVIHCDINSSKIFLDKDWEAKLSGFELSTKYPESWKHRLIFSHHFHNSGNIDPVYLKNATMTPKYDVYSFGVVLFEVLCGRKATIGDSGVYHESLAKMANGHFEEIKLDEIIVEGDPESLKIFSKTAYNCLKEGVQRPTMDQVVKDLEEALEHQRDKHLSSNRLKSKNLECFRICFSDITLATDNFNERNYIGSGGYGMVYKADLEHLDIERFSPEMEGKNKNELPKRCSKVAIKRIKRQDEEGKEGFLAEIKLLTSCKHQNIVSLLGFSSDANEMILVYEYLVNRSLEDNLDRTTKKINLTWNQRLQICLNIAEGLKYLHTSMEGKPEIIHRDIKSGNVLLDENWNAKISDFGLSKFHPAKQLASTIQSKGYVGTVVYLDPEYLTTGKYKKETDIYSFGVVLFEILSGTLAYDPVYLAESHRGLALIARRRFTEGTLKELIDPTMMVEDNEQRFTLNRGPNQDSFNAFTQIAYQCLAETQAKRPTMEVIIEELRNAQKFQGETMELYKVRRNDIVQATNDFKETCIGYHAHGMVYKAELDQFESGSSSSIEEKNKCEEAKKPIIVAIKCIPCREDSQGEQGFFEELEMCISYKHPNISSLLGFCDEGREMIFVYEHACNGSLDDYLRSNADKTVLSWAQRLHKCIEIAHGLNYLHTKMGSKQSIIHGDIRSANILFGKNFEPKIAYFGHSNIHPAQEANTKVYLDPEYERTGKLGTKSDIYSFGVVLFEILCGKLAYDLIYNGSDKGLAPIARQRYNDGTVKEMIDRKLLVETDEDGSTANKGPNQDSLDTFLKVAYQCLGETQTKRPTMETVIAQLQNSLKLQERVMRDLQISLENIKMATQEFSQENWVGSGRDWKVDKEIWETMLPRNYRDIIDMSETPRIYSTKKKKDLYRMLSDGMFLQEKKMWYSLSKNGKGNAMISATEFSYENRMSHKWRCIKRSRFHRVAKMMDMRNLKIQIKIKTDILSMDTVYGVHLVFKFCDPIKVYSNPIYVNLKYKRGSKTSHAYFAKHRDDDGWMMIELFRVLNQKEVTVCEVSLESFSRYYCGSGAIYIQGVEFQAIENMKHEEMGTQQVPESDANKDQMHQMPQMPKDIEYTFKGSEHNNDGNMVFLQSEVNGKKHLMISATKVLYNSDKMTFFCLKTSSVESRFQNVMELLAQQVFRIKYKIESEMLSPFTEYACYLVFKLSEKCRELHCPVKVRDLLHRKIKDTKTLYFRSPASFNQHEGNSVPNQRADGWMEVIVWKFKSEYTHANNPVPMNLKLIAYEGTMSGLTICGLDFRPSRASI